MQSLEQTIVNDAPMGVSVVRDLPTGVSMTDRLERLSHAIILIGYVVSSWLVISL